MKTTERIIVFTIISISAATMFFSDWEEYDLSPCGKPPVGMRLEMAPSTPPSKDTLQHHSEVTYEDSEFELLEKFSHRRGRAIF